MFLHEYAQGIGGVIAKGIAILIAQCPVKADGFGLMNPRFQADPENGLAGQVGLQGVDELFGNALSPVGVGDKHALEFPVIPHFFDRGDAGQGFILPGAKEFHVAEAEGLGIVQVIALRRI